MRDHATLERELAPLEAIKDHNQKYLITMDEDSDISYNGIKQRFAFISELRDSVYYITFTLKYYKKTKSL